MRLFDRFFFTLFGVSLIFSTFAYAQQPWSGVLSPSRAINWGNAGLPASFTDKGGSNTETTTNPWTPPSRTQYGSTINPSGVAATDLSNINTALSNCTDGHYVLLGTGTFIIQGNIVAYRHSCTLRGSGAQSTILNMSTGGGAIQLGVSGGSSTCALTSGSNYAAGSTSITCSGTEPSVGQLVELSQCDTGLTGNPCTGTTADNGGLYICGYSCGSEGYNNSQQQFVVVTSVSGSGPYTVGLNEGLYMPNWAYAQTPILSIVGGSNAAVGVGLEDFTLYSGTGGGSGWVQIQNAYASWIKGLRVIGVPLNSLSDMAHCLIFNNYIFVDVGLDRNQPTAFGFYQNSDTLYLNNIVNNGELFDGFGMNEGNVMAYNYDRDSITLYIQDVAFDHHASSAFDLFESNESGVMEEDDTFGTHDFNTYFRNYGECGDPPYATFSSPNGRGLSIGSVDRGVQRFENYVGNVLNGGSFCAVYQGTGTNSVWQIGTFDPVQNASLLRWGNVSTIKQSSDTPANSGVRFVSSEVPTSINPNSNCTGTNTPYTGCTGSGTGTISATAWQNPVPSNNTLPASFYMNISAHPSGGTGLNWWKVCKTWNTFPTSCATTQTQPFPLNGPDVSGGGYVNGYANDIPAAIAWANLPVDSTYQNSYTITASSWSGGTETLTVSGLPAGSAHLMGAFQLSGVGGGCRTDATFGNNSEILMTGSSSTTIQYALTSNPGSNACTGTMLFPDVRQFDERVYENDPSSTTDKPSAPTGIQGQVVPTS